MLTVRVCGAGLSGLMLVFWAAYGSAQSPPVVSPTQLTFEMVQGRPTPQRFTVSLGPAGPAASWTATAAWPGANPGLRLSATAGNAPGRFTITMVDWVVASLAPGTYSAGIRIEWPNSAMKPVTIPVRLTVVAERALPRFTYLHGPNGCTQPAGYADAATCGVPNQKPPGDFTPPPTGQSYVDPVFGARITMLAGPTARHAYSNPSPFSANNKYAAIIQVDPSSRAETVNLVSPATGAVLHAAVDTDYNSMLWDAADDDLYYFLSGSTVRKHDLRTRRTTTLVDYSRSPHRITLIRNGGTGDTSRDNWIAFWAPNERQVCALDLVKVASYCASYASLPRLPIATIDHVLISKGVDRDSGKRYVLVMGKPAILVYSINPSTGRLEFEHHGPEDVERGGNQDGICDPGEACLRDSHEETFEDSSGLQYLVMPWEMINSCELSVVTLQLNKGIDMLKPVELGGGFRRPLRLFRCGTVWTDVHVGCAKAAPYCVISTIANFHAQLRDPSDTKPIPPSPHVAEIIIMRDNGTAIRRLAHHRSVLFKNEEASGYWSTPRAAISGDGSLVVADSNFGIANQQRVMVLETGFGGGRVTDSIGRTGRK